MLTAANAAIMDAVNRTAELRDWFDANHATAAELWLGHYKKGSGQPSVTWTEA